MLRYRLPISRKNVKMCLLMKNVRLLTILIALIAVLSLTFAVTPAFAADSSSTNVNMYSSPYGYTLTTLTNDGKIVGARFYGMYFGASDIAVSTDIYSDENFTIDFAVNAEQRKLSPSQVINRAKLIALADSIHLFIVDIDNLANTQYDGKDGKPTSDVYRYNAAGFGDKLAIDERTYDMLLIAREAYLATNGAFNPAVYRLVDLWGFSSRIYSRGEFGLPYDREVTGKHFFSKGYPLPKREYVEAFSNPAFTNFTNESVTLTQEGDKYYVAKNVQSVTVDGVAYDQWLDLGGIAKGYVVDGVKDMLAEKGITRYSVDAGTSSQVYGKNFDGGIYNLGISDPYNSQYLSTAMLSVNVANNAVSTSGQYIRKYTTDGVEYAHIIDGALGAPAQTGVKLVSVIAPKDNFWASKGDCLTTALTVMGRDRIVNFMNGYLKDNGIKVIVVYETVDGTKQILSNYKQQDVSPAETYGDFAWAVNANDDGVLSYDVTAKPPVQTNNYTWLLIMLGVAVILAIVVVIVLHFVKGGKSKVASNVINAKRDAPVKAGDVGVYLFVVILIIALFVGFFGGEKQQVRIVQVTDFSRTSDGEVLFTYNVARNEWQVNDDSLNGWTINVTEQGNDIKAVFTRAIDGEEHFNEMTITRGASISVKMTDSVCGRNQECVRNFGAITQPNGTIVCSPNRLKIITQ